MDEKSTIERIDTSRRPGATAASERGTDTAGHACRQHAAEMLKSRSLALHLRSKAKIADAKQCLADAEALATRSQQLADLAEESMHLRGPAEAALWDLAVENSRGV